LNLGQHADFIIASYTVVVVVVAALVGWIALDYSAQRRILADLDKRGITRRSQRSSGDAS
jgi:heme exporter protein D